VFRRVAVSFTVGKLCGKVDVTVNASKFSALPLGSNGSQSSAGL